MQIRSTHQKTLILEAVSGTGVHRTAEEILEIVHQQDSGIGLATVYRNLNRFAQEGVIQKIEGPGFSLYDGNPKPHDHFHCVCCGEVMDFPGNYNRRTDRMAEQKTGARILSHSTVYEGICRRCLDRESAETEKLPIPV